MPDDPRSQPDARESTPAQRTPLGSARVAAALGLLVYMPVAMLVAFSHCSRTDAAPHVHPLTAILIGPFGLMPFHGVTFPIFASAVVLAMAPLFVVALSRSPRRRTFAAVVTIAVWTVSVLFVTRVLPP